MADERPADGSPGPPRHTIRDAGSYFGVDHFTDDPPDDDGTPRARMTSYLTGILPGIESLLDLVNADVPSTESADDPSPWAYKFYWNKEQRAWEECQARRSFADAVFALRQSGHLGRARRSRSMPAGTNGHEQPTSCAGDLARSQPGPPLGRGKPPPSRTKLLRVARRGGRPGVRRVHISIDVHRGPESSPLALQRGVQRRSDIDRRTLRRSQGSVNLSQARQHRAQGPR